MTQMWSDLPQPLDSFVGRASELAEVTSLLAESRLVTLVGPGGVGKTRLAVQLAMQSELPGDRRWFVDLSAAGPDGDTPEQAMAAVTGTAIPAQVDAVVALAEELGSAPTLVVIDNCEHLVETVAPLVAGLLARCPDLTVLVTSQQVLAVPGEVIVTVHGLQVPRRGSPGWESADAVRLFADRASEMDPHFAVTPQVVDICDRLDGIPLAIELAARWVVALSPAEILGELAALRFDVLTSPATGTHRHHSLRAVIERSFSLLDNDERKLVRRLSLLPGPFVCAAAAAMCPDIGRARVLRLVRQLVLKSLLAPVRDGEPRSRFRMLESIRQFGMGQLVASGEEKECRDRMVQWYADLAAPIGDPDVHIVPAEPLVRLHDERENLSAAVEWARAIDDPEPLALLGCALAYLWNRLAWYARAMELVAGLPVPTNNNALHCLLLYVRGFTALDAADPAAAAVHVERLASLAEEGGFIIYQIRALRCRHHIYSDTGRRAEAFTCLDKIADLARVNRRPDIVAEVDHARAERAIYEGDVARAEQLLPSVTAAVRDLGDGTELGRTLHLEGTLAFAVGDLTKADRLFREAITTAGRRSLFGSSPLLVSCLSGLVLTAAGGMDSIRALRLTGACRLVHRSPTQQVPERQRLVELAEAECHSRLTPAQANKAVNEGSELTRDELLDYAVNGIWPERLASARDSPLTPREHQIARMVADGLTNRQIASRLMLSPRTIEAHLEHIRTKLDVNSRAQISAWLVRREQHLGADQVIRRDT